MKQFNGSQHYCHFCEPSVYNFPFLDVSVISQRHTLTECGKQPNLESRKSHAPNHNSALSNQASRSGVYVAHMY